MAKKREGTTEAPKSAVQRLANPAPLGLMGFGMTTILLNLHNADIVGADSMGIILAMGIFYGGLAQIIAGIMEYKKGNTFGTTAFTSYGLFWLTLVFIILNNKHGWTDPVPAEAMAPYLFLWGLFTTFMAFGTGRSNRALQFVFWSLTALFIMLAMCDAWAMKEFKVWVGYEGIICGASAIYLAMAEVLNEQLKRDVLPIFPIED